MNITKKAVIISPPPIRTAIDDKGTVFVGFEHATYAQELHDAVEGLQIPAQVTVSAPLLIDDKSNISIKPDSFITEEKDPVFLASPAHGITDTDINNWNTTISSIAVTAPLSGNGTPAHPLSVDLSSKLGITAQAADSALLQGHNAAYFQIAGSYLTSETDPIFVASAAHGISSGDISNWNGKQPAGSYLTAITASSPLSGAGTSGSPLVVDLSGKLDVHGTADDSAKLGGNLPVWYQQALVSGSNIKTINSTSLLGNTDILLQVPLVSATNIKSINSASILASGNLDLLKIDQTTPQTITGGAPIFGAGLQVGTVTSPSGNLTVKSFLGLNLVPNGTFDTDLSGWTAGGGWAQSSGTAKATAGSASYLTINPTKTTTGHIYKLTYSVVGGTAGTVQSVYGAVHNFGNATYTEYFKATSGAFSFYKSSTFDGAIDNVTIQELTNGTTTLDGDLILVGGSITGNPAITGLVVASNGNFGFGVLVPNAADKVAIAGGQLRMTDNNIVFRGGTDSGAGIGTASSGVLRMFAYSDIHFGIMSSGSFVEKWTMYNSNFGVGVTVPTAAIHIKAGTATAGTAPLKLTAGTLLSVLELGAIEFTDNGTLGHLYITMNVAGVLTRVQIV